MELQKTMLSIVVYFFVLQSTAQINPYNYHSQKKVTCANGAVVSAHPLASKVGVDILKQGGNAVDAACAMLAATCTMWDVLSWGGETQALIYNPKTGKVIVDASGNPNVS